LHGRATGFGGGAKEDRRRPALRPCRRSSASMCKGNYSSNAAQALVLAVFLHHGVGRVPAGKYSTPEKSDSVTSYYFIPHRDGMRVLVPNTLRVRCVPTEASLKVDYMGYSIARANLIFFYLGLVTATWVFYLGKGEGKGVNQIGVQRNFSESRVSGPFAWFPPPQARNGHVRCQGNQGTTSVMM